MLQTEDNVRDKELLCPDIQTYEHSLKQMHKERFKLTHAGFNFIKINCLFDIRKRHIY